MSWDEVTILRKDIKKINVDVSKAYINPRPPENFVIKYDRDTDVATFIIGDSKDVYFDSYTGEHTSDLRRLKGSRTVSFELWTREGEPINEYGQGTLLTKLEKGEIKTTYQESYALDPKTKIYYFAVFSVSESGKVNITDFKTASLNLAHPGHYVWGYIQYFDIYDPDPIIDDSRIQYIEYYEDPEYEGVLYNFLNFNYDPMSVEGYVSTQAGDYKSFLIDVLKNKPYIVHGQNKKKDYELDAKDYTKRADGSSLESDFNNANYDGGPFSWCALLYEKEIYFTTDTYGGRVVMFTEDEELLDYGFVDILLDENGNRLKGVWLPMGDTASNGKCCGGVTAVTNTTTDDEYNSIKALRSDAKFLGGPILNYLRDIEYMLFKTTNIQKAAGYGRCNDSAAGYAIANPNILGDGYTYNGTTTYDLEGTGFQGCTDPSKKNHPGKMFHSFSLGGYCIWHRDPYTLAINGRIKVSKNYSYNLSGAGYIDTGIQCSINNTWICPMNLVKTEAGSILNPNDNHGSTALGECDGFSVNPSGARVALRLGSAADDLLPGPSCLDLNPEASSTGVYLGCATLLLPDPDYEP